ncbi:MAG: hypothetical protein HYS12_24405 [Planctomycetes bacterium]|nr:hypothetical protein [Planctomycetota bacterium]
MAKVGWATEPCGARNVYKGEWDCADYLTIYIGLPIFSSFQGCFHQIQLAGLREGPRRDRILRFLQHFLEWSDEEVTTPPFTARFPIKPRSSVRRMATYNRLLWVLAVPALLSLIVTGVTLGMGDAISPRLFPFLVVGWVASALLVLGVGAYDRTQKPDTRQARIRSLVAERLGPFSDPADWQADLALRVADGLNQGDTPEAVLAAAGHEAVAGRFAEALLLCRLALGLADENDPEVEHQAEQLTDDCLSHL